MLGILLGLFLGELASGFSVAGEIYIALLQMTVLPYILVSLMGNLGRISWQKSRKLIIAGMMVLGFLLALGIIMLLVIPLAFPDWETASFFSPTLLEATKVFDLVELFIPANPFASLANNVVPAVVIFGILMGVGISGVAGNEGLLNGLDVIAAGLNRINKLVIKLTPLGVFAIASGTAGTTSITEMSRLQAYLITYTVLAMVMTTIVLPMLVSAVTPFKYRDLLTIPRDTLITIFATAKIIVLMPQMVDNVKALFQKYGLDDEEADSAIEVLMPLAYPFPNLGTYIILMFVPFSAWYLGRTMELSELVTFQAAALLSSFVAPIISIPFLLDISQIPADMMELFVVSTVYTDRVRVVLGAMHLLCLTIVAVSISKGLFKVNWPRLAQAFVISIVVILVSLLGIRAYLANSLQGNYEGDVALTHMNWMDRPVEATHYRETLPPADSTELGILDRKATVQQRGILRVGYLPDSLPFAFVNPANEVVGFDIELAHNLAKDLNVQLELVRVERDQFNELLDNGQLDIVMSGLAQTPLRMNKWRFAGSPMDLTLALLVPDHRRKDFATVADVSLIPNLTLGIGMQDNTFIDTVRRVLPNASIETINSPRAFLRGKKPEMDAVVYSAEGGSAWTLIYPGYSIILPWSASAKRPVGYPVPVAEPEWERFVSTWVLLKKKDGTVDRLYSHWILGGGAKVKAPRWSIIRDVLHWVE